MMMMIILWNVSCGGGNFHTLNWNWAGGNSRGEGLMKLAFIYITLEGFFKRRKIIPRVGGKFVNYSMYGSL